MTSDGAVIIAETMDLYRTVNRAHLEYQRSNRERGKMSGELKIRVRFEKYATKWFDHLIASKEEMKEILRGTGWKVKQFIDSDDSQYIGVIGKENYVTKYDIKRGLEQLGLRNGDVVIVHSSLSSFGFVEGGAETVISALLETVGKEGTVVMPTYSANRRKVRRTGKEKQLGVTWKYDVLPYDPKQTPCWTGIIAETFRKANDAIRSLNPTHSIAAMGPKAKEIIDARGGSADEGFKKVLELDGYVLLIGVGLGVCSAMHLAEERVQLPEHISRKLQPPLELLEKYGRNMGWPKWDIGFEPYPDFARMENPCKEHGIMKIAKIGKSEVKLLRLRELIDLCAEYLKRTPDVFYHP